MKVTLSWTDETLYMNLSTQWDYGLARDLRVKFSDDACQ